MAHKKAGGSTRNGRDSASKRLGVKRFGGEAVRAIGAAYRLCRRFDASQEDKTPYRLSKETWQYILDHEPSRREDALTKAARQFRKLPHQA